MKTFYFDTMMSLMAHAQQNYATEITSNMQNVDLFLTNSSPSEYTIPLEGIVIGILIFLLILIITRFNAQLVSQEKFKLAIGIIHRVHTPLILLRNGLEDIISNDIPDNTTQKLKPVLEYIEHIIECNQHTMALDTTDWKHIYPHQNTEFELHNYIHSFVNQCKPYAKSQGVELKISQETGYLNCCFNETLMTVALQYLLDKIIKTTPPNSCISITTSKRGDFCKLYISNDQETKKKSKLIIPSLTITRPIFGRGRLWTVKKIIRLYGGKLIVHKKGKATAFEIRIPIKYPTQDSVKAVSDLTFLQKMDFDKGKIQDGLNEKGEHPNENPHILLIMKDKLFSSYLRDTLSAHFNISLLENPDMAMNISYKQHPDVIIIDETVNGVYGDEICLRLKADKMTEEIPIILLVKNNDNESYLSHSECRANRLEVRSVNMCKLRTDIRMLIASCTALNRRTRQILTNTTSIIPTMNKKEEENEIFIYKVRELLEKNLTTSGYTIDTLSADMGMCRTGFYNKIKEVTGKTPVEYIFEFKMEKAGILLASPDYSITEVADMLGYCDAKYFGRKFKKFYHICPTQYRKNFVK